MLRKLPRRSIRPEMLTLVQDRLGDVAPFHRPFSLRLRCSNPSSWWVLYTAISMSCRTTIRNVDWLGLGVCRNGICPLSAKSSLASEARARSSGCVSTSFARKPETATVYLGLFKANRQACNCNDSSSTVCSWIQGKPICTYGCPCLLIVV